MDGSYSLDTDGCSGHGSFLVRTVNRFCFLVRKGVTGCGSGQIVKSVESVESETDGMTSAFIVWILNML